MATLESDGSRSGEGDRRGQGVPEAAFKKPPTQAATIAAREATMPS